MKVKEKIIEQINLRLTEELTAINQYKVHSEMSSNWGFERLHQMIENRATSEMNTLCS